MAEGDLKKAILKKVENEREAILVQAKGEADSIFKQAKEDIFSSKKRYLVGLKGRCLLEKTKEINQITLEMKKQILEAKEKKVSKAFSLVQDSLISIRQDRTRYSSILRWLLRESLESLGKNVCPQPEGGMGLTSSDGFRIKLKINPSDYNLAQDLAKEFNIDAQLERDESIDAGLELCDLEEGTRVLNTFQSRLEKLMPEVRQEVGRILFGD